MADNSAALQKIIDDPDSNPSDVVKAVEILHNMSPDSSKQTGTTAQNTSADARAKQADNGSDKNSITLWDAQMMADLKAQIADTMNQYHNREIDATELNNQLQHIDKQAEQALTARGQDITANTTLTGQKINAATSLATNATSKGAMSRQMFEQLWNRGNTASGGKWGPAPAPLSQDDIYQHVAALMPNNAVAKNILASTGAGTTPDTNPGMAKVTTHQQAVGQAAAHVQAHIQGQGPDRIQNAGIAPAETPEQAYARANAGNGGLVAASGIENVPPAPGPTVPATSGSGDFAPHDAINDSLPQASPAGFSPASAMGAPQPEPQINPNSLSGLGPGADQNPAFANGSLGDSLKAILPYLWNPGPMTIGRTQTTAGSPGIGSPNLGDYVPTLQPDDPNLQGPGPSWRQQ